ncbi:aldehyde dehydrogenase family protein [Nocardia sp. NPDC058176]|uniref:aldehyde dehydrogenase family protein n=1 Tax=Nocardia sp. NPDC058176 TaxID=3346368 RepID=UPI0036D85083
MPSRTSSLSDADRGVIHVYRPADGTLLDDVAIDGRDVVAEKAAALRSAQSAWEAIGLGARTEWLERMRDWLLDNATDVADLLQAECGKVRTEALVEINWVCDVINDNARRAPRLLSDERIRSHSPLMIGKRFSVVRRPHELVGVIAPWNFPLLLSIGDAVPALLAGSAVLLKPSEVTPLALRAVVKGWGEIGAPPVLDIVYGAAETGTAVIDASDYIAFTGSVATGKKVAERAAATLTPVSLELGGKDPFLVLDGSNVKRAANCAVQGAFANNGQVCMSIERVYVEAPIYAEFVDHVVQRVKELRRGIDGPETDSDLGAITSPPQVSIIGDHVQDAVSKGAKVLTGGSADNRAGDWFEPTVLVDVDHTMKIMTEETFGPVLPIMRVQDEAEGVRLANDSHYGLGATVFARTAAEGERVARLIDTGTVNVNDYAIASFCPNLPAGGWKQSGIGSRGGDYGILKYTRVKTISAPMLPVPEQEVFWYPYTPKRQGLVLRAMRFVNARGRARLGLASRRQKP